MALKIVKTAYGAVKGVLLDGKYEGISVFRGIPYAAPPVGQLRFRPPQPPQPWSEVRLCDNFAPAPIQSIGVDNAGSIIWNTREFYDGIQPYPEMSEDCLYLNIYTPADYAGENLPVYIWYHGGGLVSGWSYQTEFDPHELAKRGIIVVQVGTRLNVFGCLSLPQLTLEQGRSGNYMLMDQLLALDWVYENISAFGGDPANITVGGESGGCTKAAAIALIPAAKGRIKRVINQSGNQWLRSFPTQQQADNAGQEYLKYLGIDPDISPDELRSLDASAIFKDDAPRFLVPGNLVIDGELIPCSMRECYERFGGGVDFLNGSNFGEADVFGKQWWEYDHLLDTPDKFYFYYRGLLGGLYDKYNFEEIVPVTEENAWKAARYLAALGLCQPSGGNASRSLMINRRFGQYMADVHPKNRVYSYLWSHVFPANPEDMDGFFSPDKMLAFHGSDLLFTFNTIAPGKPKHRPWTDTDYKLAADVCTYWCNFIRSGDPNGGDLPHWPLCSEDGGYIEFTDTPNGHQGFDSTLDRLVMEFIRSRYGV